MSDKNILDMIASAKSGNPVEFKESFDNAMNEKVRQITEERTESIIENMNSNLPKEKVEIDEDSNEFLEMVESTEEEIKIMERIEQMDDEELERLLEDIANDYDGDFSELDEDTAMNVSINYLKENS